MGTNGIYNSWKLVLWSDFVLINLKVFNMISLKRNGKLELVPASGKRSRKSSTYTPNQTEQFRISRGKFNDFLTCPRCFFWIG